MICLFVSVSFVSSVSFVLDLVKTLACITFNFFQEEVYFGLLVSYTVQYTVQYTGQYTVQYNAQYTVQFTIEYTVEYTVQYIVH